MSPWKPHAFIATSDLRGRYIWTRTATFGTVYQATKEEIPPAPDAGGFYKLETLLKGLACTQPDHAE